MTRRFPRKKAKQGARREHRRALTHVGGPVTTDGDERSCKLLATVMGDEMDADATRAHVHGFHAYPARMHPTLARRCVELLVPQRGIQQGLVLDPFCGSGTVLVESSLAGRPSKGTDLNPLAVRLTNLKTRKTTHRQLDAIVTTATSIADQAESRRQRRQGSTRRYSEEDVRLFDPHVLLELDGIRAGLEATKAGIARDAAWLVLSSILIKVSRQTADTGPETKPKRLAAGFTIQLFRRKAQELVKQLAQYQRYLPHPAPMAHAQECDARVLSGVDSDSVSLVLTSPPYAGTYDYVEHHRTRLRWLGLDAHGMQRVEIGARRHMRRMDHEHAVTKFRSEMKDVLREVARVLTCEGHAILVIADSVVSGKPIWADQLIRECAKSAGLTWLATASQPRPHFHGGSRRAFERRPRQEHTVLLSRR